MINLEKTPDMIFSKSLTRKKYVLLIGNDLIEGEVSHLEEKKSYLNYAYMVLLYSEWQVFIQNVIEYGVDLIIKRTNISTTESIKLREKCKKEIEKFSNPNTKKINAIAEKTLGIINITNKWAYNEYTTEESQEKVDHISKIRHEVAHTGHCGVRLTPAICFEYMEHLYRLSIITRETIDAHVNTIPTNE